MVRYRELRWYEWIRTSYLYYTKWYYNTYAITYGWAGGGDGDFATGARRGDPTEGPGSRNRGPANRRPAYTTTPVYTALYYIRRGRGGVRVGPVRLANFVLTFALHKRGIRENNRRSAEAENAGLYAFTAARVPLTARLLLTSVQAAFNHARAPLTAFRRNTFPRTQSTRAQYSPHVCF